MTGLVLSLFPGIGLLDRAFEEAGFCVVRGPDVLWGGDIRRFHPPAGVFDGIIGGPPCQAFSSLAHLVRHNGYEPRFGNLVPEYERCVMEALPRWFVMEEVRGAPLPCVPGYLVRDQILNNRWLGEEQQRVRRISFGTPDGRPLCIQLAALEACVTYVPVVSKAGPRHVAAAQPAILTSTTAVPVKIGGSGKVKATIAGSDAASDGGASVRMSRYSVEQAAVLQGLPADFLADAPFTKHGKLSAIANGVPLPMGRAIAEAVIRAMETTP